MQNAKIYTVKLEPRYPTKTPFAYQFELRQASMHSTVQYVQKDINGREQSMRTLSFVPLLLWLHMHVLHGHVLFH